MKFYKVTLTESEIKFLEEIMKKGKRSAMIIRNAYILLNANEANNGKKQKDEDIAKYFGITVRTIENIRKRFVLEGFETALYGKKMNEFIHERLIEMRKLT